MQQVAAPPQGPAGQRGPVLAADGERAQVDAAFAIDRPAVGIRRADNRPLVDLVEAVTHAIVIGDVFVDERHGRATALSAWNRKASAIVPMARS
ncbi:hypothetical protein ACFFGH_02675 [Lysobacter korlensis]|uniref:Uncharacterized protein n=1 Tax=Lysobacter korlensis TaxID=553636 RepID=A0ABV6RIE6_9GAMM